MMRGIPEGAVHGGLAAQAALVFERERKERGTRPERVGKNRLGAEPRAAMALKSHSEAERRRRERINAHLSTLRSLIPGTCKMDKAALLTEVIGRIKELRTSTTEISQGVNVPADADEVKVEVNGHGGGPFSLRASICCADRPDLLADLRQTLLSLPLRTVKAEISTVGGRVKNEVVLTCDGCEDDSECSVFTNNVHQALKSVLERAAAPPEFPGKRRRISSPFHAMSSSP
ncbi:transcription factor bHLH30-like [Wolffia australiana]